MAGGRLVASSRSCSYCLCCTPPPRARTRVASRTAWSSFALAALDLANQFEPVLMCTPAMREASVIVEPAAIAAKNLALSSGATLRLVPIGEKDYFLGSLTPARFKVFVNSPIRSACDLLANGISSKTLAGDDQRTIVGLLNLIIGRGVAATCIPFACLNWSTFDNPVSGLLGTRLVSRILTLAT